MMMMMMMTTTMATIELRHEMKENRMGRNKQETLYDNSLSYRAKKITVR